MSTMARDRRSGVLLHPTSLPGPHGVGDLGARGSAFGGHSLQDLSGPDDWRVGRLAEPENLFLNFGQPLEPDLYSQVAARHHNPDRRSAEAGQKQLGEIFEGLAGLDFEDDADVLRSEPR